MPELPEVETIVRELRPHLVGWVIRDVEVDWARTVEVPPQDVPTFRAGVRGRRIVGVTRRGKYVLLQLDDRQTVLVHLRMSGRLLLRPEGLERHLRVTFDLDSGDQASRLYFYSQRKFGRAWLVRDAREVVGDLGPEPLSDDLTAERFAALFKGRRGMLKPLLLNQRFLAGLGNIYVDESMHRAGLHPRRKADTLDADEVARLYEAIRHVLGQAIAHHGTTFDGLFVRPEGEQGRQQEGLRVYGQQGLPCTRCGAAIERTVVGGRGTHYCPRCQPL